MKALRKALLPGACALLLCACGQNDEENGALDTQTPAATTPAPEDAAAPDLRARQAALLDRYFAAYKAKDVDAMLALFDDDIIGVLYPATVFGGGLAAAEPGLRGDFEARPGVYAEMPHRFRIAADKWTTFGDSINGEERAALMIIFDLNPAGDRIEATYTQIANAAFIEGPSVEQPTAAMEAAFSAVFAALAARDFAAAAAHFAQNAALYAYPPADLNDHQPVIAGADDVASVLAFKWGEGAWRNDAFVSRYMQYVFVGVHGGGVPGRDDGFDRAALFTFDADPASPDYEKISRVDVMGPSGG